LLKKKIAGFFNGKEVNENLSSIMELPIERIDHYELLSDALNLARQHNLTVYDALFQAPKL